MRKNWLASGMILSALFIAAPSAFAQTWTQTDSFDYWEDQSTHNYVVSGDTGPGAYSCGTNQVLRVGNCNALTGSYSSIKVAVTANTSSIKLSFHVPWVNSGPKVYVDGVLVGTLASSISCNPVDLVVANIAAQTADGAVVLKIVDEGVNCSGDSQIADVKVYSSLASTGNTSPTVVASSLQQLESDGTTVIPVAGTTTDTTMVFKASATDPDAGNTIKILVEIVPVGQPWGGTGSMTGTSGSFASGQTGTVTLSSIPIGEYRWRVKASDNLGLSGSWGSFGGNADSPLPSATDFEVSATLPTNNAPSLSAMAQLENVTPIVQGGTTSSTTVIFEAVVKDDDTGQTVKLQVEVANVFNAFPATFNPANPLSGESSLASAPSPGTLLFVPISSLANGDYYWRARAVDNLGLAGAWTSYGTNSDNTLLTIPADTDFTVNTSGAVNPGPGGGGDNDSGSGCGGSVGGVRVPVGILAIFSILLLFAIRKRI